MPICCVIVLLFYIKCIIYKYILCNLQSTQNKFIKFEILFNKFSDCCEAYIILTNYTSLIIKKYFIKICNPIAKNKGNLINSLV